MRCFITSIIFIAAVWAAEEMQDQCMCKVLNPCLETAKDQVQICADKCKQPLIDIGASYEEARKCIVAHQPKIEKAAICSHKALGGDKMCAEKEGEKVPKRFPETLQIAAFREVTEMATKSGLLGKAGNMFEESKKTIQCMLKCAHSTDCAKKLSCGVLAPPDNEVVAKVKTCALESGFTTPVAREICTCLQKSGIKQLEPICPTLTIS